MYKTLGVTIDFNGFHLVKTKNGMLLTLKSAYSAENGSSVLVFGSFFGDF